MKRTFVSVLPLLALLGCAENAQEKLPHTASKDLSPADQQALYLKRFDALQDRTGGAGLSGYDPLKLVDGAPNVSPLNARTADQRIIDAATLDQAKTYAEANNSSAFIVWLDGQLEAETYFGETARDTLIVSKSLAKPLSVIAIGRAIKQGHIQSLDQKASDFFEEWRGTPKDAITLRHLLGMRSGLLPQGPAPTADHILNKAYLHPSHDQIIINEYPLVNEPGERYDYSNANSELIAPLIERATGVAYEDWLTQEVFNPLGAAGGSVWMNRLEGTPHSGCCILLPAQTYLRLAILLLQDGIWEGQQLLPQGFVTQVKTPSPQNPHTGLGVYVGTPFIERRGAAHPDIAFGKTLHSEPYMADDLFLFDGNANQVVYIVPSKKLIILRTGARPPQTPEWDNAILPNMILRDLVNK